MLSLARSTLLAVFCLVVALGIGTACGAGLTRLSGLFGYIPSWIGTIVALYAGPILSLFVAVYLVGGREAWLQFYACLRGRPYVMAPLSEGWAIVGTQMGFFGFYGSVLGAFLWC